MGNYHKRRMNPSAGHKAGSPSPKGSCWRCSLTAPMSISVTINKTVYLFTCPKENKQHRLLCKSPWVHVQSCPRLKRGRASVHPHFPLFSSFLLFSLLDVGLGFRLSVFVCQLAVTLIVPTSLSGHSTFFPGTESPRQRCPQQPPQ